MDIEHFVMAFDLPFYDVAFGRRETDIYIYIYIFKSKGEPNQSAHNASHETVGG